MTGRCAARSCWCGTCSEYRALIGALPSIDNFLPLPLVSRWGFAEPLDTPFDLARIRRDTEICDPLRTFMTQKPQDPHFWTKVKIDLLRREIARLEKLLP